MNWYEEDVQRVERESQKLNYHSDMVFYGSSSIRLWDSLYEDFLRYKPVNLGFGGSTLEACVYYFQRLLQPYTPQQLVVYAGDNDLGDGKKPNEVFGFYKQLIKKIASFFTGTQVFYISIKPSIARREIQYRIQETNQLILNHTRSGHSQVQFIDVYSSMVDGQGEPIPALYAPDGLHLSKQGYKVWKQVLLQHFSVNIDSNIILQP